VNSRCHDSLQGDGVPTCSEPDPCKVATGRCHWLSGILGYDAVWADWRQATLEGLSLWFVTYLMQEEPRWYYTTIVEYEPNPKHKEPWQAGRKGSLCPRQLVEPDRLRLLQASEPDPTGGKARYSTDGERAFSAFEHSPGRWHGFPVGWKEVPESLRRRWRSEGRVNRRAIRKFWESSGEEP
jgi:hypothetical protein